MEIYFIGNPIVCGPLGSTVTRSSVHRKTLPRRVTHDSRNFRVASPSKNLYSPEFYYRDPPSENKTSIWSPIESLSALDGHRRSLLSREPFLSGFSLQRLTPVSKFYYCKSWLNDYIYDSCDKRQIKLLFLKIVFHDKVTSFITRFKIYCYCVCHANSDILSRHIICILHAATISISGN